LQVNKVDIGNTVVDSIAYFTAQVSTSVINTGGNQITQYGHCWSTTQQPTVDDQHSSLGSLANPKTFTSNLKDLEQNTIYYIRPYFSVSNNAIYGEQQQLTTLKTGKPVVQTNSSIVLGISSAHVEGIVVADSGLAISQKGFCWSSDANPNLSNNLGFSENGPGIGSFADTISGLNEGTEYFIVAYATNEKGTSYGEIKTFQTVPLTLPTIVTHTITQVTYNSAISGGEVINEGNGNVSARGVCWNIQPNPSLSNNVGYTIDGAGTGVFESNLTGLSDGTDYYYVAYATNEGGTSYGEVRSFSTPIDPCDGVSTVNYGGQIYHMVTIGEQCWMKENLNYATGNSWCYENNLANCNTYGRLYDWETIMNGEASSNSVPSGVQGICPDGWHVPSDEEWKILEGTVDSQYGGGDDEWDETDWRGHDAGNNLITISGWISNTGSDLYGFSALPGGSRGSSDSFYGISSSAYFWSSTEDGNNGLWHRLLGYGHIGAYRGDSNTGRGLSLRCVKD